MAELHPPLDPGYRIELFAEQEAVTQEDVIELWERGGVVSGATAARRVHEILFVGIDRHDEPVALTTAYLQRNLQLGLDLWYCRAWTAREHRMGNLALVLALRSRDHLERGYVDGDDMRGRGLVYEIENAGLRTFNDALWFPIGVTFIGENERGDHVRIRYFPGARAPEPPA